MLTTSTKPFEHHPSSVSKTTEVGLRWRVLIVDPHTSIREMIRVVLDGYSDLIEVVGEASDGDQAVQLAKTMPIDLVLMDVHLPNGVDATYQMKHILPQVVIMGMSEEYAPYLYNAMIAAGAVAFVRVEDAADLLFRSIVFAMCNYGPMHRYVNPAHPVPQNTASFL
ncbi:MAG TPA: response regulator transcription factor [Nitrospira sp.]|nr:response regulator transcription factor [Nitrospira sp.]